MQESNSSLPVSGQLPQSYGSAGPIPTQPGQQRPTGKTDYKKKGPVPEIPAGNPQQPRQLNVKDALSYLELVKFQFSSQPEIYHRFLEIMKDFKNQE